MVWPRAIERICVMVFARKRKSPPHWLEKLMPGNQNFVQGKPGLIAIAISPNRVARITDV
jgi:hypothetical protein